jgi:peptidoglycan DL-endopeptidase CwlO
VHTCRSNFGRHAWQVGIFVSLAALFAGTFIKVAAADPVAQKEAEARVLAKHIDTLSEAEAALSEQYDKALLDSQLADARVQQAGNDEASALDAERRARAALENNALDAYTHGGNLAVVAGRAKGPAGMADGGLLMGEYVRSVASNQSDVLDQVRRSAQRARKAEAAYVAARAQAARSATVLAAARTAAIAAQKQLRDALSKVKQDIATLIALDDAAKAAARAAQRPHAGQVLPTPAGSSRSRSAVPPAFRAAPPPVGSGAAAAVAAARSRIGAPYEWSGAGPAAFDCSGLVMWAWGQGGVRLPHYSGGQYAMIAHISMSQLEPGDLVFFANPSAHVAMYVGGGMIIEAAHAGTTVAIVPMYSEFVLAGRP